MSGREDGVLRVLRLGSNVGTGHRLIQVHPAKRAEADLGTGAPAAESNLHRDGLREPSLALGAFHNPLEHEDGAAEERKTHKRDYRRALKNVSRRTSGPEIVKAANRSQPVTPAAEHHQTRRRMYSRIVMANDGMASRLPRAAKAVASQKPRAPGTS